MKKINYFCAIVVLFLAFSNLKAQTHMFQMWSFEPSATGDSMIQTEDILGLYDAGETKVNVKTKDTINYYVALSVSSQEEADSIALKNKGSYTFTTKTGAYTPADIKKEIVMSDTLVPKEVMITTMVQNREVAETTHNTSMIDEMVLPKTTIATGVTPTKFFVERIVLTNPSQNELNNLFYRFVKLDKDTWVGFSKNSVDETADNAAAMQISSDTMKFTTSVQEDEMSWGLRVFTNSYLPYVLRNNTWSLETGEAKHVTFVNKFFRTEAEARKYANENFSDITDITPVRFFIR